MSMTIESMPETGHDTINSPPSTRADEKKASRKPDARFYGVFVCLCILNLVCAFDATALSVALPIISTKLNGSAVEAYWAGTSYLLASAVFMPSWASLSHIFGRRPLMISALALFTVGTIIAGIAHNFTVMLVGRTIQGLGGGGVIALTYVIVTDLVSLRDRGKWFGLITSMWALACVTAPIIGGALAQHASWRWIFWIQLPLCGLGFVTIGIFLHLHYKVTSLAEKLKRVDWVGTVLFVTSLTSFLIPITWGGTMYDWGSYRVLVPLLLGVAGIVAFALYEKFLRFDRNLEGLIRFRIFRTKHACATSFLAVMHSTIVFALLYYLPLYFEAAKGFSPTMSGVGLLPQTVTTCPASVVVGIIITKTGKYRWAIYAGWVLAAIGLGLQVLLRSSTNTVGWIFLTLTTGIGTGMLYTSVVSGLQASASNEDLPFAAAMYSFFRAVGQIFGVAVGAAVFQNTMLHKLRTYPELAAKAQQYSRDASGLVQVLNAMPASQLKNDLRQSYVESLRVVWIVMCAIAGVSLIISLVFVKEISLDREHETEQGFIYGNVKDRTDPESGDTIPEKQILSQTTTAYGTGTTAPNVQHALLLEEARNDESDRLSTTMGDEAHPDHRV